MAITTMDEWTTGQSVHSGEKPADGETVHSTKDAQHLADLMAEVIAVLDEMKGQL
jgi:hypothetical protein